MKEDVRDYPLFSLCGLNCGLCPRYQSKSASKCPGCGGLDFSLKHPACAVISCNRKHDNVEYCFQCASYPCDRYVNRSIKDSFITYHNVISDFEKARIDGIEHYQQEMNEKVSFLKFLIDNYNDGRKMNFYCIAVNRLSFSDLSDIKKAIQERIHMLDIPQKEKVELVAVAFEERACRQNIELRLRK